MVTLVPSQTSVAVGGSKFQTAPHSTTRLEAQLIAGGVVSMMVTVWLHCALLVCASIASQTRVAEKVRPQSALVVVPTTTMVTFEPSQLSKATGAVKSHDMP